MAKKMKVDSYDMFVEDEEPVENEDDIEQILAKNLSASVVQATDWTVSTILSLLEKGRIVLNPAFQRRDAWDDNRKSKFVESLLLGFPIPQLVLAESAEERGKYLIIDGKQRLLTLLKFAGSRKIHESFTPLKLKGLEILRQLNDNTLDSLRDKGIAADELGELDDRTIRTVVVRHWKHEAVLYHIFLRLNTGTVQLSPQELRNALHPGPFAQFIDNYSGNSSALHRILGTDSPYFRMRDAELLLRYYSFCNFMTDYSGSM